MFVCIKESYVWSDTSQLQYVWKRYILSFFSFPFSIYRMFVRSFSPYFCLIVIECPRIYCMYNFSINIKTFYWSYMSEYHALTACAKTKRTLLNIHFIDTFECARCFVFYLLIVTSSSIKELVFFCQHQSMLQCVQLLKHSFCCIIQSVLLCVCMSVGSFFFLLYIWPSVLKTRHCGHANQISKTIWAKLCATHTQ